MNEERRALIVEQALRVDWHEEPGHVDVIGSGRAAGNPILPGDVSHVWITGIPNLSASRFRRTRLPS